MSSRQKSCLGCVRSKRKCDQRLPKCRRCIARRIDCEYAGRNPARPSQSDGADGDASLGLAEVGAESTTCSSMQLQQSPASMRGFTPYIADPFLELANDPFGLPSLPVDEFLSSAVVEDIMADRDPEDAEVIAGAMYQARVEFAAKRVAEVPKIFAERAQTMFIHRCLFQQESPQPLQDALSVCALYCLKNPDNQALVFRNLENKAQQLVSSIDLLRVSRTELLVAVQALLLYQIIRLFDGDIRLRAQAEADEATFLVWAKKLKSQMRPVVPSLPPSAGALFAPQNTPPNWLRWLLEESIRRTVFTALMVKGLYEFLKYGYDKVHGDGLGFTAQAALWNAQSEYGWRTAYCERERLEVTVSSWDQDIAKATPDDLEELGVLTMATFWGLEGTAEWLGKNCIARYGLE